MLNLLETAAKMGALIRFRPSRRQPWNRLRAAHLLNRAGFGGRPEEIDDAVRQGLEHTVQRLLDFPAAGEPGPRPDLPEPMDRAELRLLRNLPEAERQQKRQEILRAHREAIENIRGWWIRRMLTTPRPLQEKLTLFWHGHFATSAHEVKNARHMFQQNELFRRLAAGNLRDLVLGISRDPAMLAYLDNNTSRKEHPNENYARELLELFTMGIGQYTEEDVQDAARAFTGWTFRPGSDDFLFLPGQHDDGLKTFLGQTGQFDGTDIVDIVLTQPVTARFISRKLFEFFVYDDPAADVVEELATALRKGQYEVKPFLEQLFQSEIFYSARAFRTQIKSPVQLVIGTCRLLGVQANERALAVAMRGLGQDLLFPPNVKGWEGGEAWINTNTLLLRYNLAGYLLRGKVPDGAVGGNRPGREQRARRLLERGAPIHQLDSIVPAEVRTEPARVVDRLVARLLQTKLDSQARNWLVEQASTVPSKERAEVVAHLIMCMPDFQLC